MDTIKQVSVYIHIKARCQLVIYLERIKIKSVFYTNWQPTF